MIGVSIAPTNLGFAQNSAATLESGLNLEYLVSAFAMGISLLLIFTLPELTVEPE